MKSPVETVIDLMNETPEETAERRVATDEKREEARIENLEYQEECKQEDRPDWDMKESDYL